MKGDTAARRYASALFDLGKEQGSEALQVYGETLSSLAGMMAESPDLARALKAPVINTAEKRGVVLRMLEALAAREKGADGGRKKGKATDKPAAPRAADTTIKNFLLLLTDRDRLGILDDIAASFGNLLDAELGLVRGELVTAVSLSRKYQDRALTTLEKQVGKKLVLRFAVDPSILGGIVLRVGDTVLDASLRAQLDSLRDTIKRGV